MRTKMEKVVVNKSNKQKTKEEMTVQKKDRMKIRIIVEMKERVNRELKMIKQRR